MLAITTILFKKKVIAMESIRINRAPISFHNRKQIITRLESQAKEFNWLSQPIIDKSCHIYDIQQIHKKYAQNGDHYFEQYHPKILQNTFLLMLDIVQEMVNGRDPFISLKINALQIYPQLIHEQLIPYYKKQFESVCVHQNGIGNTKFQFFADINYSNHAQMLRDWFLNENNYKLEKYQDFCNRTNYITTVINNLNDFFYKTDNYEAAKTKWTQLSKNIYKWKYELSNAKSSVDIPFEIFKPGLKLAIAFFDSGAKLKYQLRLTDNRKKVEYNHELYKFYIWDIAVVSEELVEEKLQAILYQLANDDINDITYLYTQSENLISWIELFSDVLDYIFEIKSYEPIRNNWQKQGSKTQQKFLSMSVNIANSLYQQSKKVFKFA
jgi:hypothetical protein